MPKWFNHLDDLAIWTVWKRLCLEEYPGFMMDDQLVGVFLVCCSQQVKCLLDGNRDGKPIPEMDMEPMEPSKLVLHIQFL